MPTPLAPRAALALAAITLSSRAPAQELEFPPTLSGGQTVATAREAAFLQGPGTLRPGVSVARSAPEVDFLYYPGQDYPGKPWSNWGDSLAVGDQLYASIGDHLALGGKNDGKHGGGTARVFAYDATRREFRLLADVARTLARPAGHYTPGKIHGRLDLGQDGWLYFSTHRGSTSVTSDAHHYEGDWILRCHPEDGRAEVVALAPMPRHCLPASVLDPERMLFYAGTAPGGNATDPGVHFLAYDLRERRVRHRVPDGPPRCLFLARSTGRVYYVPGSDGDLGTLHRYDPSESAPPRPLTVRLAARAATEETPQGIVYTVSKGSRQQESLLYAFHTREETVTELGPAAVAEAQYITSLDADATGRYLYYVPGAHGGAERDGTPVVQFDTRTRTRKVIAFLHPFHRERYGATLTGTFSSALSPAGDKLYVTWNVIRGAKAWDCCALTVIHIPESERQP
jgi:hypothetical protein